MASVHLPFMTITFLKAFAPVHRYGRMEHRNQVHSTEDTPAHGVHTAMAPFRFMSWVCHYASARRPVEQFSGLLSLLQVSAGPRDKEGWAKRFREASSWLRLLCRLRCSFQDPRHE